MNNQIYSDAFWEAYAEILVECWSDKEFKERFKREPEAVFKEWEFDLPVGLTIKVIEQSEGILPLGLPPKPRGFDREISVEDLDAVAGGTAPIVPDDNGDPQPTGGTHPLPPCK
ncbi:hypothetical protein CKO15_08105 [Halorhodospira abdelmalekii]|uniref:NHLP leader peptide family RiPP precursor n=1 Tax=Halorhodospira abdelmalekii TaxID=421629 RepID=UPI00190892D8|nr:NHLP leader peptide family RiPP precursor [Halorhodospira abdelmalekii]MBK1735248.1 hypothetical protein [Halorhodospira abdelmalekii]